MELMMDQGIPEGDALLKAFGKTEEEEMVSAAKHFGGILNTRYFRIKLFLWITFGLFCLSWLFSSPLGLYAAVLSFLTLAITLLLLSADFIRSRKNHLSNLWFGAGTLISALLVLAGYVLLFLIVRLRIDTKGHGVDLMIFSYVILALVIFLYFMKQRRLSLSTGGKKQNTWFAVFSGIQLFFAVLSFLSLPFYAWAVDYIWILIWAILGVNAVSLIILSVRKIRNILFLVLLLLSFMITFIHSPLRRLLPAGKPPITQTIQP
jgi:hypothetical protein